MKVLQLVQKPQRRGAEIFAFQLSETLRDRGHDVRTGYLYPYSGESPLQLIPGDRVFEGEERNRLETLIGYHPALLAQVKDFIRDFEPDIVQVNGARTVKYGAFARRRTDRPWKLIYRNIDNPAFWVRDPLRRWFYRARVFPHVDGSVGVSRLTLDEAIRIHRLRSPSVFIPNGIDVAALDAAPSRAEARRMLDVGTSTPVVLFMGNLGAQKRPDRFVRVLKRVIDEMPEAVGWVLGRGPAEHDVRRLVRSLRISNSVRFWGYEADVRPHIAAANLLLVTSDTDGIPAVVLEAGYLHTPTVATRVGALHECVIDEETGLLYERDDEPGLAEGVLRLIRDPATQTSFGEAAHALVAADFAIEAVAARYESFYEEIATGNAGEAATTSPSSS